MVGLMVFLVESTDLALGQLEGMRGCPAPSVSVVTGVTVTGESPRPPHYYPHPQQIPHSH